ncbi:MAG: periplasmic heavy metal sensor [Bacteroidetes bacterium]|nr:periplasmic heavy metal sensor [Bacteroidota bacterium]
MNKQTKKTLLILLIAVLVVINISALITIIYSENRELPSNRPLNNQVVEEIESRGMYHFLRDELKLTDAQFDQFRDIQGTNMSKSRNIAIELSNKRREMMNEIAKVNPNKEKLDTIAKEIGELHYHLKLNTINHFLELKEICNEEQQESIQRLFINLLSDQDHDEFRPNEHRRGRNRRGRPQGRD